MRILRLPYLIIALALTVGSQACVKKGVHEETLSTLAQSEEDLASCESSMSAAQERISELEAERTDANAELATCERSIRNTIRETEELNRMLDSTRAQLLEATEALAGERSRRSRSEEQIAEAQQERERLLEELNRLQAEARERQRIYDEIVERFQSLIDAGQLDVTLVDGRLVINMPQDILFGSGSASLSEEGQQALAQVGTVLADFRDRRFQVEGHTDNVPISTSRFPSNWELSAARALAVVHLLVDNGVPPDALSAAGYGEFRPVAPNDSAQNRERNRRIEIVILPNLEELAPVRASDES